MREPNYTYAFIRQAYRSAAPLESSPEGRVSGQRGVPRGGPGREEVGLVPPLSRRWRSEKTGGNRSSNFLRRELKREKGRREGQNAREPVENRIST